MIVVTWRGTNYNIPEPGDAFTQSLTDYLVALPNLKVTLTTASFDYGTVAQYGTASHAWSVTGALTTGTVTVSPTAALPAGVTAYGYVSAAGTVTIVVTNCAGAQDVTAAFNVTVTQ